MKNFDHPYFSKSISEFWRRWHISLSTWFRDYVYIPLGGNRTSRTRWAFNIFITFLISGLWHGANWTFVIWGALHGGLIIFFELTKNAWQRLSQLSRLERIPKLETGISILSTFTLVSFTWVFFRAASLPAVIQILKGLFSGWSVFFAGSSKLIYESFTELGTSKLVSWGLAPFRMFEQISPEPRGTLFITLFAFLILVFVEIWQFRGNPIQDIKTKPIPVRLVLYAILVTMTLTLGTLYVSEQQAFIYFQF
jgi:hypothetical protein